MMHMGNADRTSRFRLINQKIEELLGECGVDIYKPGDSHEAVVSSARACCMPLKLERALSSILCMATTECMGEMKHLFTCIGTNLGLRFDNLSWDEEKNKQGVWAAPKV